METPKCFPDCVSEANLCSTSSRRDTHRRPTEPDGIRPQLSQIIVETRQGEAEIGKEGLREARSGREANIASCK